MTVIAFKDGVLAADKRSLNGRRANTVTKIFRARSGHELLAVSGDLACGLELVDWYNAGADPHQLPPFQRSLENYVPLLIVRPGGLFLLENATVPFQIEEPFFAMGSGRDYALMAMHLGRSAIEAVELTSQLTTCCGNGVDYLRLV